MAVLDDSCNSLRAEESEKMFTKVKMFLILQNVVKLRETFDHHKRCLHKCPNMYMALTAVTKKLRIIISSWEQNAI